MIQAVCPRGLNVGGNASNTSYAGLSYLNSNHVPSNVNANRGSRNYLKDIQAGLPVCKGTKALPLGKKYSTPLSVGSPSRAKALGA